jgi:Chalcone isomerase-like
MWRSVILWLMSVVVLLGVELHGVNFPDRLTVNAQEIPLRGTAHQTWKIWWTVHVTAWWQNPAAAFTDDTTKVLELAYFHNIPASAFVTATKDGFARGRKPEELVPLQARIEQWNAAYQDIKKGERYRMTYVPNQGTSLIHGEKELVRIPGLDFANGLFGIWLGDNPVDGAHRTDLLDGK